MSGEKVLIVDDDEDILLIVQTILTSAGYTSFTARNGREGVDMALQLQPDLILLDVMMPELSGWEVCTTLKNAPETRQIPVAMLTVKSEIRDLITGMQVGADDYVTKPFRLRELVARVRAALRRAPSNGTDTPAIDVIDVGEVRLDVARHEVFVRDDLVALPLKEFELLELLLLNAGRVLTRDVLIDRVWGPNYYGDTKTLDVHVKRLRAKIEPDPANPVHLVTVRGVGYRYEKV
jgi:two-component system, OmpR family, response regulator RegX3